MNRKHSTEAQCLEQIPTFRRRNVGAGVIAVLVTSSGFGAVASCGSSSAQDPPADASVDRGVVVIKPPPFDPVSSRPIVIAGGHHACAILEDESLRCWGSNTSGELGNPQTTALPDGGYAFDGKTIALPQRASLAGRFINMALGSYGFPLLGGGYYHTGTTCAVLPDKQVQCWGDDRNGTLGRGPASTDPEISKRPHPESQAVKDLLPSEHVATNGAFSCAVGSIRVRCWGFNPKKVMWTDQYGGDTVVAGPLEITLPQGRTAKHISTSLGHLCALLDDASVACWGRNENGELGSTSASPNSTPTVIPSLQDIAEVKVGDEFTCVRTRSGQVQCFGATREGRLGRGEVDAGSKDHSPAPVALPAGSVATQIAVGVNHACAILSDRSVWCWGDNSRGGLGAGRTDGRNIEPGVSNTPLKVQGLPSGALYVTAGSRHTCAVLTDKTVMCWGDNEFGQLARGTTDFDPHPEPHRVNF